MSLHGRSEGPRPFLARRHSRTSFREYVDREWLPHEHLEAPTRAAYVSYLNKHFYPFFGHMRLNEVTPSLVEDWVVKAEASGLAPRSIRNYHVLLSSIFGHAVRDQVLERNPCDHTELPKSSPARRAPSRPRSSSD
jgi:site-specific recombinase XerD